MANRKSAARQNGSKPAIPPEVAERIAGVIGRVMCDLRAMRNLAIDGHGNALDAEDVYSITEAICERAHVQLDHCVVRLGGTVAGNFRDAPLFDDRTEAAND